MTASPNTTWQDILSWLVILLSKIMLWFVLVGGIAHGLAKLEMTHYQPSDTPNRQFMVVIQDDEPHPIYWHEYDHQSHTLATTPSPPPHVENYLFADEHGNWVYRNEGALWHNQSTYRIDDGRAVPLSYLLFTVGHVFYGIIGASLVLIIINHAQRRFTDRHHPNELASYHQHLRQTTKRFMLWMVVVGVVMYGVVVLFR